MIVEQKGQQGDPRRKKRRRRKSHVSAAKIVETVTPTSAVAPKPVEVALSAEETAEMRHHLRFLRQHRKLLRLRVNAAEDLLLNGVREPTHRGVCNHLLAKVDRARVESACDHLDPDARRRFLEGILRISPEIGYLLLYLESVKDSASRSEASTALARALRRLDFGQVSPAQMRRVLELVVELFDASERPRLLLKLLESSSFEAALRRSEASLPPALAELVVPLRAAQQVVIGEKTQHDSSELWQGVALLLTATEQLLEELSLGAKRRLFELCLAHCHTRSDNALAYLRSAASAFPGNEEIAQRAAAVHLRWGKVPEARGILQQLSKSGSKTADRWIEVLDEPRLGRVALPPTSPKRRRNKSRFRRGVDLYTLKAAWVRMGSASQADTFAASVQYHQQLVLPGIAAILEHGTTSEGRPYFAVEAVGNSLPDWLRKASIQQVVQASRCVVQLIHGLASQGLAFARQPALGQFSVDTCGRVWLCDLEGVGPAQGRHLDTTRSLLHLLVDGRYTVAPEARKALSEADSCSSLIARLDEILLGRT